MQMGGFLLEQEKRRNFALDFQVEVKNL